jgi:SPP1 gp7 family putative phage head morphogenesis protein
LAVKENVALIKSIPSKYFEQIESQVLTAIRAGKSGKELTDIIEHTYKVTTERAKLIAVDQAGKMLGDVTRIRHEDLGLEYFRWVDSNDNRVRPKHREFNGKVYSWAEGAPGGIFPGQEIRCRCTAEVIEDELIDKWVPEEEQKKKKPTEPGKKAVSSKKKTSGTVKNSKTKKSNDPYTWNEYQPFNERTKAIQWMGTYVADYTNCNGMSLEQINETNRALFDMIIKNKWKKLDSFTVDANGKGLAYVRSATIKQKYNYVRSQMEFEAVANPEGNAIYFTSDGISKCGLDNRYKKAEELYRSNLAQKDSLKSKIQAKISEYEGSSDYYAKKYVTDLKRQLKSLNEKEVYRWSVSGNDTYGCIIHEFGHVAQVRADKAGLFSEILDVMGLDNKATAATVKKFNYAPLTKKAQKKAFEVSEYAGANAWERWAESWAAYHKGGWERTRIPKEVIELIERVIESGVL